MKIKLTLVAVSCVLFGATGCGSVMDNTGSNHPSTTHITNTISNTSRTTQTKRDSSTGIVVPPSIQYADVVRTSIGNAAVTDLQFRYIRQLNSTLSVCLFTFDQGGKALFNEALVSKENGQWAVAYTASAAPVHDSFPFTKMDMNGSYGGKVVGNTQVGSTPFQIIGGFINDPAISSVDLVDLTGRLIRRLPIIGTGEFKMYAYAQISPSPRIQGWQIRAYDKSGDVIGIG